MARAVEPGADDARRAGLGPLARRARRAHRAPARARPGDHADPDRARHGRRPPRRRARDHDARRPGDHRGDARRDSREPDRARPLPRPGHTAMAEPLLVFEDVCAYYGRAQALHDVSFEVARRIDLDHRPERHGQDHALQRDHGRAPRTRHGLDPPRGPRARRPAVVQDREARDRLRAAGAPPLPVALRRRAPADDPPARRLERAGRSSAPTSCSRASASAGGTAAGSFRAASSRCSRSRARSSPTRASWSWTSRPRGWRRRSSSTSARLSGRSRARASRSS